ncbi:MAG: cell filamentation protein Fic [Robiginitomaculum sp.]|nr:MAG: cell filamentation protein Fic [Robiginitomaculum sp.]
MTISAESLKYFQGELLPTDTVLVGWAALVQALCLEAPVHKMSCISKKHIMGSQRQEGLWRIYDKRYAPQSGPLGHIVFAFKHENIDLLLLRRAFVKIPQTDVEVFIAATPTGSISRRIWFFYELLTGKMLDIDDAPKVGAVDALDTTRYFTSKPKLSKRHRVRDNLLGGAGFCPVIRRTDKLQSFIDLDLANKAANIVGQTSRHLISRAASFMLLADSRSSFAIEGERPPRSRLERWGQAVLQAGKTPLNQTEIYRLHRILLGDDRFTQVGYRKDGVFLGKRDHNHDPLPEFIGARYSDVPELMTALNVCNNRMRPQVIDPVIQAAIIAFGFVYIHPLEDGNGRLHRCLIHHVLTERKFSPAGMVFPVSSVMLDRIEDYQTTLQNHSAPLMPFIEWQATEEHNVEVLNDTADLYRYSDCTREAEFLYECVRTTVETDLPREIAYLTAHDEAEASIMVCVEMPNRRAQDLIIFVRQNNGVIPKKRREKEFSALTDIEVANIEKIIADAFKGYNEACALIGRTP